MDKRQLMDQMRMDVGLLLVEIEDEFKRYGLPITNITLVARDPANDKMIVVLSNEDAAGRDYALNLALNPLDHMTTMNGDGQWKDESGYES